MYRLLLLTRFPSLTEKLLSGVAISPPHDWAFIGLRPIMSDNRQVVLYSKRYQRYGKDGMSLQLLAKENCRAPDGNAPPKQLVQRSSRAALPGRRCCVPSTQVVSCRRALAPG